MAFVIAFICGMLSLHAFDLVYRKKVKERESLRNEEMRKRMQSRGPVKENKTMEKVNYIVEAFNVLCLFSLPILVYENFSILVLVPTVVGIILGTSFIVRKVHSSSFITGRLLLAGICIGLTYWVFTQG